jgi:hypothetical protein
MATRHIASSRNLLNLFQNYMNDLPNSPIRNVAGGIVLRAGWHSVLHRYNFTTEYPWLPDAIREAHFSSNYQVALPLQVITKIAYMLFTPLQKSL